MRIFLRLASASLALSASLAIASPADIAKRSLAHSEAGEPEVSPAGIGWTARFHQTHAGLPVIGSDVVVRIDDKGKVLRRRGEMVSLNLDVTPKIDLQTALAAAKPHARSFQGAKGILAIDPLAAGGPRLVWAVRPQPVPQLLENALYLIDAKSGAFLKRIDLLKFGKANVFLANPINTPTPVAKDFPADLEPTNADGYLEGALLKGYDCIDTGEVKPVDTGGLGSFMVHICTVTPTAKNATYDYTGYQPLPEPLMTGNGCPGAPIAPGQAATQPLDEFSEQHMYWHVADGYAFFRQLFADNKRADFKLRAMPLAIAVNLCTPDFSGGLTSANLQGPLVPFDNAFFSPGANNAIAQILIDGQDSIMFGQGPKYDYAYDGDVIKHEFTHAVIDTLGKLTLGGAEDVWGLQDDQGAMNEGLADFFSSVQSGDPILGEYAGRNIVDAMGAEGAVRNLTNKDECGKNRWGEVHQDSQAFSAALWGARVAIAGDPKGSSFDAQKAHLFDRAVLAAIQSFPGTVDMTSAAMDISSEVKMLIDDTASKAVDDSFTTHKILPVCDRVIEYTAGDKKDLLGLDGTDSPYAPSGAARVPGFVQWKIDVPVGNDSITATMKLVGNGGSFSGGGGLFGGGAPPKLELIAGPAGRPIQWVVKTDAGNEVGSGMFSGTTGQVTATVSGLTPGPNYVMIVNSGGGSIAQNITFDTSCTAADNCAPDMALAKPDDSSSGCKCSFSDNGSLSFAPLGLLAFALVALRRRRRS
jgi:MYXO-CTERM domain-containing protein